MFLPLQRYVAPKRRSVVIFVRNDEDPHITAYKSHQQPLEISFVTPKRLLQQYRALSGHGRSA
jgi:hypothetical protein